MQTLRQFRLWIFTLFTLFLLSFLYIFHSHSLVFFSGSSTCGGIFLLFSSFFFCTQNSWGKWDVFAGSESSVKFMIFFHFLAWFFSQSQFTGIFLLTLRSGDDYDKLNWISRGAGVKEFFRKLEFYEFDVCRRLSLFNLIKFLYIFTVSAELCIFYYFSCV